MSQDERRPLAPDPIVDEVRAIRARLWREAGEDFDAYCRGVKEFERRQGAKPISVEESRRRAEAHRMNNRTAG